MLTRLTFVRSEEDDPFGLLLSTLSSHNHSLWGLSSRLLFLGCIPISKWGLRPNTKVQAFTLILSNIFFIKYRFDFFFIFYFILFYFFLKSVLCYKIADFEIQKKGLRVRLKFIFYYYFFIYIMHA